LLRLPGLDRVQEPARHRIMAIAGVCALWAGSYGWFRGIRFETLMGDDLYLYFDFLGRPFWRTCFLSLLRDKYRPVYACVQYAVFKLFGAHYPSFFWFNVAFHAALASLLYLFLAQLTRGNWVVSFLFAAMFVTARFAYYDVAQVLGLMEALALLWMLALLFCAWKFWTTQRAGWLAALLASFTLIVFTHERYLAVAPFLLLPVAFSNGLGRVGKVLWGAVLMTPVPLYAGTKVLALHSGLLLGTGGAAIRPVPKEVARFWFSGMANLFGINIGPSYLSIRDFPDLPLPHQLSAVAFAATTAACIVLSLRKTGRRGLFAAAAWAVVTGSLVLTASITVRQEFRWLFAPYLASLLFLACAIDSIRSQFATPALVAVMFLSTLFNDWGFRAERNELFFMSGELISDSFYRATLQRYGALEYDFYLEPFQASDWILPSELYFGQFEGGAGKRILPVDPRAGNNWSGPRFSRARFFAGHGNEIFEVTEIYRERAFFQGKRSIANLVDLFGSARVTGRLLGPDFPGGSSISIVDLSGSRAICALPSSSISFEVPVPAGPAFLTFVVDFHPIAKHWGVSDGARASVKIATGNGNKAEPWTEYLEPKGAPHFVSLPLGLCEGTTCRVTLETSNDPGKNADGDWLVWIEPRIVASDAQPPAKRR
jgi:hypothetical protein